MPIEARTIKNLIGARWSLPTTNDAIESISPVTGAVIGRVPMSGACDVDDAVAAAVRAQATMRPLTVAKRVSMLNCIGDAYERRMGEMARAITTDIGAPITLSRNVQAPVGLSLLRSTAEALRRFRFEDKVENARVHREGIGVCALITPWNWPMNQIVAKVAAALAAGCTMVLKPSEYAPRSATLFAQIVQEAGIPDGVFNLIHGGIAAGEALASHEDVRLVSITGSTRAGTRVAELAAPTIKRVVQELGGKSACIVVEGSRFEAGIRDCVRRLCVNSGQSCNAPTRLLVPISACDAALDVAADAAAEQVVGDPIDEKTTMGPLVNERQFDSVRHAIRQAQSDGAQAVTGGPNRPPGLERGYFVAPTVLANAANDTAAGRNEIFGPVLCVIGYEDLEHAIFLANNTRYGLAAYVHSDNGEEVDRVARRLEVGMVYTNGAAPAISAPFGGYKQSGNGRERGAWGIEEFLETKAVFAAA